MPYLGRKPGRLISRTCGSSFVSSPRVPGIVEDYGRDSNFINSNFHPAVAKHSVYTCRNKETSNKCTNRSLVWLGHSNKLFRASKIHIFIARGIGITGLKHTLGPANCIVSKTTASSESGSLIYALFRWLIHSVTLSDPWILLFLL
jgi:hypothetical protein